MALGTLFPTGRRGRATVSQVAARVVCESLERRQLLATYPYVVPSGHTAAYIEAVPGGLDGQVQVRLDSPTGDIDHTFENTTGMDIIDSGTNNPPGGFLFVDKVAAEDKPISDGTNDGIKVQGGSGGHLKIEAADIDQLIRITESTSTSATIEVRDLNAVVARTRFGDGVDELTIQTHSDGGAAIRVATVEPGDVMLPGLAPGISLHIESLGQDDEIRLGGSENAAVEAVVRTGKGNNDVYVHQDNDADATTDVTVDFDPTIGGGPGNDNQLLIGWEVGNELTGVNCNVTLKRTPQTSHTMRIENVFVGNGDWIDVGVPGASPATLRIDDPVTIGELWVSHDASQLHVNPVASIRAPITVTNSPQGTGKLIADGTVTFTGSSGQSTVREFAVSLDLHGVPPSTGIVNVNAGAVVTAQIPSTIATLNIPTTGKLTLAERASFTDPAVVLTVRDLFMGATPTGQLDVTNNGLIVNYSGTTPHDYIEALITSAYAGGAWTGSGIRSSTAAGSTLGNRDGVGYAENDVNAGGPGYTEFLGRPVDDTSVLVRYTLNGDTNLDATVNLIDFNRLAAFFGQSNRNWVHGDSNYDGEVNLQDFNRLAANFGSSLDPGGGGGGEGFGGGEEYTYEDLLAILMEMYPEYF